MNAQGNAISVWVRRFLAALIVDVIVEFYQRTKTDPVFNQKIKDAFAKMDSAQTQEESDDAAKSIQALISG